MLPDELTPLEPRSAVQPSSETEDLSRETIDISRAIDDAGFGCGTILYFTAGILLVCLEGAEVVISTVVGPMLRCEWDLTSFQLSLLQTTALVAMVIAGLTSSPLGDKFGRKPVSLISAIGTCLTGMLCAFAQNFLQFVILRTIIGLFVGAGSITAVVLTGESVPSRIRAFGFATASISFGIGASVGSAVGYLIIPKFGWRYMVFAVPLVFSVSILLFLVIDESPRYNFYRGRFEKAKKSIEKLYWMNGKGKVVINLKRTPSKHSESEEKLSIRRIFTEIRDTGNTSNFILINCLSVTSLFIYYTVAYLTPRALNGGICDTAVISRDRSCVFDSDVLFEVGVVSLAEPLGVIATILVTETPLGRRLTFLLATISIIVLCTPLYWCVSQTALVGVMLCIRLATAGIGASACVLCSEYMPTLVRAFSATVVVAMGRAGGALGAFCTEYTMRAGQSVTFGVMQGVGVLTVVSLLLLRRETRGVDLA